MTRPHSMDVKVPSFAPQKSGQTVGPLSGCFARAKPAFSMRLFPEPRARCVVALVLTALGADRTKLQD